MGANPIKVAFIAAIISIIGFGAAWNAKWIRDGSSPWWTVYLVSICTSSMYGYLARYPLFSLTYTSAFQTFFFHSSWYLTTLVVIGEHIERHQVVGLILIFAGMLTMSLK
jgi:drug/metabolite transporter (DMT)-like permease